MARHLGDETFGGAALVAAYVGRGGWLLTPRQLSKKRRYWKDDLYAYRKVPIELLIQLCRRPLFPQGLDDRRRDESFDVRARSVA